MGLVSRGFADNEQQGQELIDGFLNQYPNVKIFLDHAKAEGLYKGYTQDPFGRVRWYQKPKRGEAPEDEVRKIESSIARRAQNMKIQSMSANITKMALRDIYYYLKEKNFGKIILTIHDSIFLELHQETAEESIPKIIELMENSGPKIFDGMIVPVDADIGIKEKRTCIISGVEFYTYSHTYDGLKIKRNEQNVEPRVYALVDGNVSNIYEARKKLLEELAGRDDDWKIKNYDIINAIKTVN